MNTRLVSRVPAERIARSARVRAVSILGPMTVLAGIGWAIWQPYRLTLLHPHGQGFWWLAIEPPLLVVLVGVLFHFLVAPAVIEDLEAAERRSD